jgi:Fe-Mn family superoxide dismutase
MKNIHWERVGARFQRVAMNHRAAASAVSEDGIAAENLLARLQRQDDLVLLDVCLAEDLAKRSDMIPGAQLRAPEQIADWAGDLPKDKPIVAYCVYGFQVSGDAVAELRRCGLDAYSLSGGIAAWHAIGAPTVPLITAEGRPTP